MNNNTDKELANEIRVRYKKVEVELNKVKHSIKVILSTCIDLTSFVEIARQRNKNKMAWWCKNFMPSVSFTKLKILESIGSRTSNKDNLMSWQARMLEIVSSIHHKDKPINPRNQIKIKRKSWVYHVSKGHEGLVKQIEQMGGINNLDEDERNSIMAQFGSLGEVLIRLNTKK